MKIAVGMSGGVDSSTAALILKEQGHEVIGISMALWDGSEKCSGKGKHSCYGPDEKEDIAETKKVCDSIGIPFFVLDCSKEYKSTIIEYFKSEYMCARTPNPCVLCNYKIKFDALLKNAQMSGISFDKFATGHYANVEHDKESGRYLLKKASDKRKDQTYFLYRLSQSQLSNVMFPLGDLTKEEVRGYAREKGLRVAEKEESQDFYGGDYRELLDMQDEEGDIVLTTGEVVGRHRGLWNYTPGQRRGMGIAHPEPLYVIRLDSKTNTVVAGIKSEIIITDFIVNDLNWIAVEKPEASFKAQTKVRSSQNYYDSFIEIINDKEVKVTLKDAGAAISPGQSAVFYSGDIVIGGGIIDRVV
ncbi:MAG: tRNA 2-thiouridine(34) synthase MnmA [Spirochaetota bacterium]